MGAIIPFREAELDRLPQPGQLIHSFDTSTPQGKRALHKAITGADLTFEACEKDTIHIVNLAVHRVPRVDNDTGELRDALRIVVQQPDGSTISGGSESIYRGVLLAAWLSGQQPPFDPPLSFIVRSGPRKEGPGKYLFLEWIGEK